MGEPIGHQKMRVWQNTDRLDVMVQQLLKKIPKYEYQMRGQIDSASDSIGSNFIEGYYSSSTKEYLRFLHYARRSLGELHERIRRLQRKGIIVESDYEMFNGLSIRTMYLFDRLVLSLKLKLEGAKKNSQKK